jgi:hypothetical protein
MTGTCYNHKTQAVAGTQTCQLSTPATKRNKLQGKGLGCLSYASETSTVLLINSYFLSK